MKEFTSEEQAVFESVLSDVDVLGGSTGALSAVIETHRDIEKIKDGASNER